MGNAVNVVKFDCPVDKKCCCNGNPPGNLWRKEWKVVTGWGLWTKLELQYLIWIRIFL